MLTARCRGAACITEDVRITHHRPALVFSKEQTKFERMNSHVFSLPLRLDRSTANQVVTVIVQQSPIMPPVMMVALWACQ